MAAPIAPQLAILLLALVLAALGGAASFGGLIAAYGAAWLIVEVARARGVTLPRANRRETLAAVALISAAPLVVLFGRRDALAESESLVGIDVGLRDHLALEGAIAIHPDVLSVDRPQTLFVRADGASRARLVIGTAEIESEPLGHGVFRIEIDPRQVAIASRGRTSARIETDRATAERGLEIVAPLAHPRWLRVSEDRTRACTTSEETDELVVIDAAGARRVAVGDGPSDCAFDGDAVLVSHRYASALWSVDADARPVEREIGDGQHRIAVAPDRSRTAVGLERGEVLILGAGRPIAIAIGGLPDWIAFGRDASTLIVARRAPAALLRIAIDDHGGARIARQRVLLAPAVTMARLPDGARVVIAATDYDEAATPHVGNHFVEDQLLHFDTESLALVDRITTGGRTPRQDAAGGLDRGLSPIGIDPGPDGAMWVAFAGSDELADLGARPPRWVDAAGLGLSAPCSVIELADHTRIATSPSSGRIAIIAPDAALRETIALAPDDHALLRDDPDALRRRYGERAFYEATRSGVSCQSCHLHGASDGAMHNIGGRVLVPTLDVRGIRGTAPYLRDGSYPRISDLHVVADEQYRGYREAAGDRGATIEAWIASQPRPRSPRSRAREPEAAREARRRGLDVFVRAGCPDCHAPPAFTHLARHPTRSVFPDARAEPGASLDVPSLLGVSLRARWLFDGRATSLRSIFEEHGRGDRHGRTSTLAAQEIDDLLAFLESL